MLLTFNGTAAIYQAAAAIGFAGGGKALVPAYNCGHEIEPLVRAGADVDCYRVGADLQIDVDDLAARLKADTRAVLVTHYFGFPQRLGAVRELCDAHGAALIEDCAHALFSRDGDEPLGRTGDFAVYSIRKSLPVPHGGALVCRDAGRWALPRELPRPPALSTAAKLLERYQKGWLMPGHGRPGLGGRAAFLACRLLAGAAGQLRDLARRGGAAQLDPDDEGFDFPVHALGWGAARTVEARLAAADAPRIVAARRRNYALLLAHAARFAACRPLLGTLPAGVCPLYFPLLADDAEDLVERLHARAISSVEWWSIPHPGVAWDRFPEAWALKHSVVVVPIHQDLGEAHMARVADALAEGAQP